MMRSGRKLFSKVEKEVRRGERGQDYTKKKIISIVLCTVLVLSIAAPAVGAFNSTPDAVAAHIGEAHVHTDSCWYITPAHTRTTEFYNEYGYLVQELIEEPETRELICPLEEGEPEYEYIYKEADEEKSAIVDYIDENNPVGDDGNRPGTQEPEADDEEKAEPPSPCFYDTTPTPDTSHADDPSADDEEKAEPPSPCFYDDPEADATPESPCAPYPAYAELSPAILAALAELGTYTVNFSANHPGIQMPEAHATRSAHRGTGTSQNNNRNNIIVLAQSVPTNANAPTHPEGFRLVGWNTRSDGTGQNFQLFSPTGPLNINHPEGGGDSITLYAMWGYRINFIANAPDPSIEMPAASASRTARRGTTTQAANHVNNIMLEGAMPTVFPNVPGLSLVGWNTRADGTGTFFLPTAAVVLPHTAAMGPTANLYGVWVYTQYTINFVANVPNQPNIQMPDGEATRLGARIVTATAVVNVTRQGVAPTQFPEVPGHRLVAWNTRPDGTGIMFTLTGAMHVPHPIGSENTVNVYGVWGLEYTVNFVANVPDDYTIEVPYEYRQQPILRSTALASLNSLAMTPALASSAANALAPLVDGFEVSVWNTRPDGTGTNVSLTANTLIPHPLGSGEDITLYGIWRNTSYTVNFLINAPEFPELQMPPQHSYRTAFRSTVTALPNIIISTANMPPVAQLPQRPDGLSIVAWNTEPDGSGARHAATGQMNILHDLTDGTVRNLYAVWGFAVMFDANIDGHPSIEMPYGQDRRIVSRSGANLVLPVAQLPTPPVHPDGLSLVGWNLRQDGTGTNFRVLPLPTAALNIPLGTTGAVGSGLVTIYAVWG